MNQSVINALQLLDLFIDEKEDLSLSEIHRKTNLSKPTVYRLLSSLVHTGYLKKIEYSEQDIRYQLGMKLLQLGNIVSERLEVQRIALPYMKKLCDEINEIVHLAIMDGNNAVYVEKVESSQAIRLYTKVGKGIPLHIGSGPKLLFSFLPDTQREEMLKKIQLSQLTKNTITSKSHLREELEAIRKRGYAESYGEQNIDTTGISFPIKDFTGKVVAALTVSGPSNRVDKERKNSIKNKLNHTAKVISKELGFLDDSTLKML